VVAGARRPRKPAARRLRDVKNGAAGERLQLQSRKFALNGADRRSAGRRGSRPRTKQVGGILPFRGDHWTAGLLDVYRRSAMSGLRRFC
jgi:hypothetical protein